MAGENDQMECSRCMVLVSVHQLNELGTWNDDATRTSFCSIRVIGVCSRAEKLGNNVKYGPTCYRWGFWCRLKSVGVS